MKITNDEIKKFFYGTYYFGEFGEYIAPYRFSKEQFNSLTYDEFYLGRSRCTASVYIGFMSDAERLSFDYNIYSASLKDTFDVYINGVFYASQDEKNIVMCYGYRTRI